MNRRWAVMDTKTPPDSGEREVVQGPLTGLRLDARILAGAILIERRSREDGMLHHKRGCNGESADGICDGGCALERAQRVYAEMGLRAEEISLPLSLAQRILAALNAHANGVDLATYSPQRLRDLASELSGRLPK